MDEGQVISVSGTRIKDTIQLVGDISFTIQAVNPNVGLSGNF
jgi:hypothetical protein